MGALMPIASVAVAAGSKLAGGVMERNAQYRAAGTEYENARLSVLAGEQGVEQILDDERMAAGASLAAQGGNGLATGGSIATLIEQSAFEAERALAAERQRAFGEASNYNARGDDRIRAGKNALIGGIFGAVSTALNGAAQLRQQKTATAQSRKERNARLGNSTSLKKG